MIVKVQPSQSEITAHFATVIDAHVESVAKSKGYNSAASCASYVSDPNAQWAAEATAFVQWRSSVWSTAYQLLATATEIPTEASVMAALPAMTWPESI
jgi:hypothetical protein